MEFPEKYSVVKNFIEGKFEVNGQAKMDVFCPLDGKKIAEMPLSKKSDLDKAVESAQKAFKTWSKTTVKDRAQIFFRYKTMMENRIDELSNIVHLENGKTFGEAKAEVEKSIELTEFACSMPQLIGGEILEVSKGVECRIDSAPLGVVASIAPFNFPHMVPHWTIPNALVLGNCMILKPSEKVPISSGLIAEMLKECGLPDGVFNVVNGDYKIAEAICDHPGIEAVSFVGSTKIAKLVYIKSTSNLKRCVALGGAKNHLIVLPDATPDMTAINVTASMSGCAGQRCMAASAMVAVGNVDHIIEKIVEEAKKIIPGENLGAVITKESKDNIEKYIAEAEKAGAKILVDGRNTKVKGKDDGYYVGPTVIDFVTPEMAIAKEEVFGPVLAIIRSKTLDEALKIENSSNYGNAASVFTQNGSMARHVMENASAGMVGVNIGVPVPREPFSFGGWNESKFGACDITGKSSIEFWTRPKKTSVKWNAEASVNWMS
ncbi:CoA-acylating methylmalonate-semialdehyde dehydrogenase [soil metagenome]